MGEKLWERRDGQAGQINIYAEPVALGNGNVLLLYHRYVKDTEGADDWLLTEVTKDGGLVKATEAIGNPNNAFPLAAGQLQVEGDGLGNYSFALVDLNGNTA